LRRKKKSALVALFFSRPPARCCLDMSLALVCVFLLVHPSASMAMTWPSKVYAICSRSCAAKAYFPIATI
jgi:hypothetical protein